MVDGLPPASSNVFRMLEALRVFPAETWLTFYRRRLVWIVPRRGKCILAKGTSVMIQSGGHGICLHSFLGPGVNSGPGLLRPGSGSIGFASKRGLRHF